MGLARDSLVLTREGFKPIQDVGIGDKVLTHKDRWKEVTARLYMGAKPIVQLKAQGIPNLFLTPDHGLWAKVIDKPNAKRYFYSKEPEWIRARGTDGGWIVTKLPPVEESSLDANEWQLVGQYLAYGHFEGRADILYDILNRLLNSSLSEGLIKTLRNCGRSHAGRQVPIEGLCLNRVLSEALMSGYVSERKDMSDKMNKIASVSRALTLGMSMVAQNARNVIASIYGSLRDDGETNWILSWLENYERQRISVVLDDGAWRKVKGATDSGTAETWDLQVKDDASYSAEGCVVKGV